MEAIVPKDSNDVLRAGGRLELKGERMETGDGDVDVVHLAAIRRAVQEELRRGGAEVDFEVTRLVIYAADPPEYVFTTTEGVITMGSAVLLSRPRFKRRFVEVLGRVPELPEKSTAWDAIVSSWLAKAETVEMPPECSRRGYVAASVEAAVADLRQGEGYTDLQRGCSVVRDGAVLLRLPPLLDRLQETVPGLTPQEVGVALREAGWSPSVRRLDGMRVRTWALPVAVSHS